MDDISTTFTVNMCVKMGKNTKTLSWFILLLALLLGAAVAELTIYRKNPVIIYIWSGGVGPVFVLLLTIYLMMTGKLPKDRMKPWAVIAFGMLLMSFSGILTSMENFNVATVGLILLIVGFLVIIFAGLTFRVRKV